MEIYNNILIEIDIPVQYNSKMLVDTRLRIGKEKYFMGKGVREILDAIDEYKSIKKACEVTGISYPKVMRMLKNFKGELGFDAVASEKGGRDHGGTQLTEQGRAVLESFREIENEIAILAQKLAQEKFPL